MERIRGQGTREQNGKVLMVLQTPFDLSIYTPEYTQPDSPTKSFHDGDAAWKRFLAARPQLYLPGRAPVVDEDPIDRSRRLWTHQELSVFADVIQHRSHVQLLLQERTLRRWHQSATHIQRCFRGLRGRLYVLQLRREMFDYAATLERALELARQRRRHRKAAIAIQRCYRPHHKLVLRQQSAAVMLQSASKRFMLRLRRWKARLTIQRAVRCFLWRMRWQRYKRRIRKLLTTATRQQQLVAATETFKRVRETVLLQRQADTWASHPERMQILLHTRQHKQKLQASPQLPLLKGTTARRTIPAKSSNKVTWTHQHSLPAVYPSSRGE